MAVRFGYDILPWDISPCSIRFEISEGGEDE